MKAYLIDTPKAEITEIEFDGDWRKIAAMISADIFTIVVLNVQGDVVYVDDEGLINGNDDKWFAYPTYLQPLKGKGLILGTGNMGESVSPVESIEHYKSLIEFYDYFPEELIDRTITIKAI